MHANHFTAFDRVLELAAARRGIFAGILASMLAANLNETVAKRKRRRNQKKRGRRKKRRNQKPKTRVDATCPEPAEFSLRDPDGNNRYAQTFTAKSSGPLISAELSISKLAGSPGDYILRLSPVDGSGIPTNEVLAEAIVANADVPDGGGTVPFTFGTPYAVKAGNDYALVLTRSEGTFGWGARGGDACAGSAFRSPDQTAPFTEGVGGNGNDFIFTAFVRS